MAQKETNGMKSDYVIQYFVAFKVQWHKMG